MVARKWQPSPNSHHTSFELEGPHFFHSNSKEVWRGLSVVSSWIGEPCRVVKRSLMWIGRRLSLTCMELVVTVRTGWPADGRGIARLSAALCGSSSSSSSSIDDTDSVLLIRRHCRARQGGRPTRCCISTAQPWTPRRQPSPPVLSVSACRRICIYLRRRLSLSMARVSVAEIEPSEPATPACVRPSPLHFTSFYATRA